MLPVLFVALTSPSYSFTFNFSPSTTVDSSTAYNDAWIGATAAFAAFLESSSSADPP